MGGLFFQHSLGVDLAENKIAAAYIKGSFKGPEVISKDIFHTKEKYLSKEWAEEVFGFINNFIFKNNSQLLLFV